mgnify:CR=1 FL=1
MSTVWVIWFTAFVTWMFWGLYIKWFVDVTGLTPEFIVAIDDINEALGSSI